MRRKTSSKPAGPLTPPDLTGVRITLIGIGGCGMSGLARMLASRGAIVSGSDKEESETVESLRAEGIAVTLDQQAGRIPEATDVVVASAAIRPDHPEMVTAIGLGIPVLTYAEALGQCMVSRTGVAIAGTHGKSTTVALLGHALLVAGLDPTVVVGAVSRQLAEPGKPATGFHLGSETIPTGAHAGSPGLLLVEACEYNRSFHRLCPTIACITSVEADHLDIYGSLDAVVEAFADFASMLPKTGGKLLIAHEGAHRREVTAGVDAQIETIGFAPMADWHVTYDTAARRVGLNHKGKHIANWVLRFPGEHMAMNSAMAATLAIWLGAPTSKVSQAMETFEGVDRRMQLLGEVSISPTGLPVRIYDDYGHHPTEIDTTLRALREFERPEDRSGRLICVFQPHQHSRTRFLLDEFAQAFAQADIVIVPHIYFVRDSEVEKARVSASDLVDRLRQRGVQAMHVYPFEGIVEQLDLLCRPADLLVVMGAGPVWRIAREYMNRHRSVRDASPGIVRPAPRLALP